MEFREINTFIAVARQNSFSKAATQLGYSQAAVTLQIRNLETELGVALFDRLGKTIRMTSQGKEFYRHALMVCHDLQAARESVRSSEKPDGFLHIGTIDSICASIMPELISSFINKYPEVKISVMTDTPAKLFEMLGNNEIDLIYLVDEKIRETAYRSMYEKAEKVVFAANADHPLADGAAHSLPEVLPYPLMLTEKDASYRKLLDVALAQQGIEILPAFQSNNTELLLHLVRQQGGVTFLPEYALEKHFTTGAMAEIKTDLEEPVVVFHQVIHHKNKWVTEEMKAFVRELESCRLPGERKET